MQQQIQGLSQQTQCQISRSLQSNSSTVIGSNVINNRTPVMPNKLLPTSNHFNAMDCNEISLRPAQNSIVLKPHLGMNKNKMTINQMINLNSNPKLGEIQNSLTSSIGSNKSNKLNNIQTNIKRRKRN